MLTKETTALALIEPQLTNALNPIVLCSFGKDSLVLLHLCLRIKKVPVLFFKFAQYHNKYTHALEVIKQWDLEVYDYWPQAVQEYQHGDYFEVLHSYSTGGNGFIHLFSGVRERTSNESHYLCAVEDLLLRPKAQAHDYPWDVTFHGHKGTDDPELGESVSITNTTVQLGNTKAVIPFVDWSNKDIWDYIHKYDLPYDTTRYNRVDKTSNPDEYPTCFKCIDTRIAGQMITCPKYNKPIQNIAKPERYHQQLRSTLLTSVTYCDVKGASRSTPSNSHITDSVS